MPSSDRDWLGSEGAERTVKALMLLAVLMFLAALVFFGLRDHYAVARCHDIHGKTWDSGKHCVLPSGRVVNTHDRLGL